MAKTLGPFRLSIDDDGPDQAPLGHGVIARLVGTGALKATGEIYDLGRRCRVPVADVLFDHAAGPDESSPDPYQAEGSESCNSSPTNHSASTTSRRLSSKRHTPTPGRARRTSGRIYASSHRHPCHRSRRRRLPVIALVILITATVMLVSLIVVYSQRREMAEQDTTTAEPTDTLPEP